MVDIVDPEIAESRRRWNVLVADADEDSLLSLEKAFEECDHKVTKCKNADECLAILQEKKGEFQLIIIEVSMPEIDGYELSRRIRKETDIPIILMSSAYSRDDSIPKVLECGASEFLLKPINAENVRNIKLDSLRNLIRQDSGGGEVEQEVSVSISRDTTGHLEEGELDVVNPCSAEKRSGDSIAALDPPARKKQRVIWTTELHEKFVSAVTKFGLDHAVPKKIMEVMNVSGLTRENVASHLQKYRQYHKKKDGINISQPKQPSRRQQEHKRSKSSDESLKENHELKALYPEPALPQATALEALDYKVHGGSKIGCQQVQQGPLWTDDVLQQRGFQAPFVDHAASYHTNQMVPTYDHASFDPLIGWRQQPLPTYLNSVDHTEFVDASNEMCCQPLPYQVVHDQSAGQLPNETGGHDLFPQCDTDQLPGYHYHDDHVSGLHLVPKIEHSLDHLNIQMAGNTNLQGNTTTCYNYATTSTYYQQGGQLNFNATSVSTAGFEHHLYQDDHQASLVEDCQRMFSSSYYDHPPLYLDQPDPQVGPMIDQPHPMNQEGADEKIGFKELAEE